ncbi:MAG: hypothetical protein WBN82_07090 [Porticoccaceae bacterium]
MPTRFFESGLKQAIVAQIEAEQALVAANRELIARFEQKSQATLARAWGEDAGWENRHNSNKIVALTRDGKAGTGTVTAQEGVQEDRP